MTQQASDSRIIGASVPEVDVLEGESEVHRLHFDDDGLKVIALLTRNPDLITLDRDLDLELHAFDVLDEFLGCILCDALVEGERRLVPTATDLLWFSTRDRLEGYVAAYEFPFENVDSSIKPAIRCTLDGDPVIGESDRRICALEVVSVHDLSRRLVHSIADLLHVYLGNDVE